MNPEEIELESFQSLFSDFPRTLDQNVMLQLIDNHIRNPVRAESAQVRNAMHQDALKIRVGTSFFRKARATLITYSDELYLRVHTGSDHNVIPLLGAVSQYAQRRNAPLTIYFGAQNNPIQKFSEAFCEFTPVGRGEYRVQRQND